MSPLTDKDREVLERLGFKRSSVTGNWVRHRENCSVECFVRRDFAGVWAVRIYDDKGPRDVSLGSPELIPSLVFAEIEGA